MGVHYIKASDAHPRHVAAVNGVVDLDKLLESTVCLHVQQPHVKQPITIHVQRQQAGDACKKANKQTHVSCQTNKQTLCYHLEV